MQSRSFQDENWDRVSKNNVKPFLDRYTKFLNENGGTWFVGNSVSLTRSSFSIFMFFLGWFLADYVGRYRRRRVRIGSARMFQREYNGFVSTIEIVQREDLRFAAVETLHRRAS